MPAPTISHPLTSWQRPIYGVVFAFIYLISLLPLRVHYFFSDVVLFPLVYHIIRYRRKIVHKNISSSFPEKDDAEVRDIGRRFYHWFCDYIVETIKLFSISREEMKRRMVFVGTEQIKDLMEQGVSVGGYMGHICNWEWVSSMSLWFEDCRGEVSQVYHVLENPVMDHLLLYDRARMGGTNVAMSEIMRYIVRKKRDGQPHLTGFNADQAPMWNNIHLWVPFLNHPQTPVFTGTERLLKRFNMAAAFLDIRRVRRGYYEGRIILISPDTTDIPDYQLTEQYIRLLEERVRQQPECYLWSHNRWKRTREEYDRRFGKKEPIEAVEKGTTASN